MQSAIRIESMNNAFSIPRKPLGGAIRFKQKRHALNKKKGGAHQDRTEERYELHDCRFCFSFFYV
jgi:hypothetical protein